MKYIAKELAEILGISRPAIIKRAKKEKWPHKKEGKKKYYSYSSLPKDVQVQIAWHEAKRYNEQGKELEKEHPEIFFKPKKVENTQVPMWAQEIAVARASLVAEFSSKKGVKAKEEFVEAYNTGELLPETYKKIGKISLKTLYRWEKTLRDYGGDFLSLAPAWGSYSRGKTKVTNEEASLLLSMLLKQNRPKIQQAIRQTKYLLKERGIPSPSSYATLRRFVERFKNRFYDVWVLAREGEKALIDKVLPHLERNPDVLKTGDILVADGHKCNFQVINPYTGKPCRPTLIVFYDWASRDIAGYSLMITENISAVHLALYRAILRIGRIPTVVYLDNGKAFRAKIFTGIKDFRDTEVTGLYARLGIQTIFARPYNARAKTVERFFRTLDEFERMLPTFVGSNINDKPARMLRNEKFMQLLAPKHTTTIEEAEEWLNRWLDYYRSQPHEGLHGLCPKDVFRPGPGVDPKELYLLMLCEKDAKIYRNGVRLFGYYFWNEALYGLKEKVVVRYDLHNLASVLVFSQDGDFICAAKRTEKVHPAAKIFGDEKSYTEIKRKLAEQKKLKKLTKKIVEMGVSAQIDWQDVIDVVPEVADELEQSRAKAIEGLKENTDELLVVSDDEIEDVSIPEGPSRPIFKNETDKYFYLMDEIKEGRPISEEDKAFIEEFEKDPLNKATVSLVRSLMGNRHNEAINN